MGAVTIVLVHSPFVGPGSWSAVGEELRRGGRSVAVPSLVDALTNPSPLHSALAGAVADAVPGPAILVVHSGAGPLVPAVVDLAPAQIENVIFVDATLPHPGRRWVDTVPAELAGQLTGRVGPDGLLPRWHEWFPPEAMAELVPAERARVEFCADVPRVPLRYLEEIAPGSDAWQDLRCGYVQLSAAYEDAAVEAGRAGWPVARVDGHHLSGVTDPAVVAAAIARMSDAL
ncbi:alpha/beta hydrolase [Pseudonocardia sp. DSM 110487]|uniref:alpha/beta hydrolase n=1 Tax=Pseudonocardia sp. DSM 110487 TaxID=2865833 RepID=UPI001C69A627|nr:alpha/beta hydrolase [Pseudonocardia sp. DSM 110487]QYN35173.1 alpha/beta hydrolase [Pseudonocardia sp. DSM 110487]